MKMENSELLSLKNSQYRRVKLSPAEIRSHRISELTRMAVRKKSLDEIMARALQMASKKTAREYVDEVIRRVPI